LHLETPLSDPRILQHEYTLYAIEYNVVINLRAGRAKCNHGAVRSSDGAGFKKILLLAEADIMNCLQVVLLLQLRFVQLYHMKITFKFSYLRGGVEVGA